MENLAQQEDCPWVWLNPGQIIAVCCKMCVMSTGSNSLSSAVTTQMFCNCAFNLFFFFQTANWNPNFIVFQCKNSLPCQVAPTEGLLVESEHCNQCSLKQKLVNIDVVIPAFAPIPCFAGQEV